MSEESTETKKREPRKNSLPFDEVAALGGDLPSYDKSAWHMIGHKDGIRVAIPRTNGVSRAFFYANDDYDLIPDDPAITIFSPEERKERKLGGIMAKVEFELGLDAAKAAIGKLIEVVAKAPPPAADATATDDE